MASRDHKVTPVMAPLRTRWLRSSRAVATLAGLLTGIILAVASSVADLIVEDKTSSLRTFALYFLVAMMVSGVLTAGFLSFSRWTARRRKP